FSIERLVGEHIFAAIVAEDIVVGADIFQSKDAHPLFDVDEVCDGGGVGALGVGGVEGIDQLEEIGEIVSSAINGALAVISAIAVVKAELDGEPEGDLFALRCLVADRPVEDATGCTEKTIVAWEKEGVPADKIRRGVVTV